jgi:LysM repeat protein
MRFFNLNPPRCLCNIPAMARHAFETRDAKGGVGRRAFIGAAAGAGAGALLLSRGFGLSASRAEASADGTRHLVWVWQFSSDAAPNVIAADLRNYNLGILLKTHDGVEWMSKYDKSPFAVSGPKQVETLARYYEDAGVPFHAWAVVKGENIIQEARMAADVLSAGARSIYLDVEPHSSFWTGGPAEAAAFGQELRRLQPNGWVVLSIDVRPWELAKLPMNEFASFSSLIAPQLYWRTFNTQANYEKFAQSGMPVPPWGITPEFLVDVSNQLLAPYGKTLVPVGQGATDDMGEWHRFLDHAYATGIRVVSAWRYGVAGNGLFSLLRDRPPVPLPQPVAQQASGPAYETYVVQPGDTLSKIAAMYGTTVDAIVQANGLENPNLIAVGQQLQIPVSGGGGELVSAQTSGPDLAASAAPPTYTVQPGDTLSGIAARFGTSVSALANLNGLADPNILSVGQVLRLS